MVALLMLINRIYVCYFPKDYSSLTRVISFSLHSSIAIHFIDNLLILILIHPFLIHVFFLLLLIFLPSLWSLLLFLSVVYLFQITQFIIYLLAYLFLIWFPGYFLIFAHNFILKLDFLFRYLQIAIKLILYVISIIILLKYDFLYHSRVFIWVFHSFLGFLLNYLMHLMLKLKRWE